QELLRICGVSDAVYWASMFLSSMLVMSLVALLLTIMVKLPMFCALAVLPHSDFSLVLAIMLLYSVYSNLFCLLVSCLVKTPVFAVFATVCLWMLTYELPLFFMDVPGSVAYSDLTLDQKLLSSVFPNVAIHWIFRIVNLHEEYNDGSRWSNLHLPGSPYDNVTLLHMVVVVFIYCLIYALFVWYLDNVWPWQYGIPKEPLFCFKVTGG
ncbi:unnamed protein product, partial [Ixodes pacificus]